MTKRSIPISEALGHPDGPTRRRLYCPIDGCSSTRSLAYNTDLCDGHAKQTANKVEMRDGIRERTIREREQADRIRELERELQSTKRFLQWEREDRAARPKPPTGGTIYYLRSGEHIKIGWTSNLTSRMLKYAPNATLIATEPGTRADEARRHEMFAVHRTHGREWYAPTPSILHHVEMVKARHGEPPTITVGAKPVTIPQPRPKQYTQTRR